MKTIFESTGLQYESQGDYMLPKLRVENVHEHHIGIWGRGCPLDTSAEGRSADRAGRRDQRYRRYLKEHHSIIYYNYLTAGTLYRHLAEADKRANEMFGRLVKELSAKEGVTEKLKADNPLEWGAGRQWRPLPKAEAPTEPAGETANEQYPFACVGNRL